jgi:hypothetical protein
MFGNTQQVAQAIGDGLAVILPADVVEVGVAPTTLPVDVSLLVVGGPTHAFGMTRPRTRADAAGQAKVPLVSGRIGVREWLSTLESPEHTTLTASFDTHMDRPQLIKKAGSAAGPIERRLHKLGFSSADDPQHFWVADTLGPLREGQLQRARRWGELLAAQVTADAVA